MENELREKIINRLKMLQLSAILIDEENPSNPRKFEKQKKTRENASDDIIKVFKELGYIKLPFAANHPMIGT